MTYFDITLKQKVDYLVATVFNSIDRAGYDKNRIDEAKNEVIYEIKEAFKTNSVVGTKVKFVHSSMVLGKDGDFYSQYIDTKGRLWLHDSFNHYVLALMPDEPEVTNE